MLICKPTHFHPRSYVSFQYRKIVNGGYEWHSLEECLAELAEIKELRKTERKKKSAYNKAVKRERAKLEAQQKKLALAKLALFKRRKR